MSTIIIDRDTCTMVLDSAELTADRVRPCVDAIADAVETALEADGVEGVEVVREYRTTASRGDNSEYHSLLERVLVGGVDALRAEVLAA